MQKKFTFILVSLLIPVLANCNPLSAPEPSRPTIIPAQTSESLSAAQPEPTVTLQATSTDAVETIQQTTLTSTNVLTDNEAFLPMTHSDVLSTPTSAPTRIPTANPSDTPTVMPTATNAPVPLSEIELRLSRLLDGFTKPLYLTHAQDERLFVVEQVGKIFVVRDRQTHPTPFLDIESIVGSNANEQGLLSVAFHPEYPANGYFYVNYTNLRGDTVIARYTVSADADFADPNSQQILLTIPQPYGNHNGGLIKFGPDGYLYVGMGDGGSANDPHNYGQRLNTMLGKILRLDVNQGSPYGVPETNPFVFSSDGEARPEIWSYGWRNPWRFGFDRLTGDLYLADVGQNQYEEINVELAGTVGGQNYGWRLTEGRHCFNPADCDPNALPIVLPVTEYNHSLGCSVTGGYVYRGSTWAVLNGVYLYGDYCTGYIWGLQRQVDGSWAEAELLKTNHIIGSFGEDYAGELYLIDHRDGSIWQIEAQ